MCRLLRYDTMRIWYGVVNRESGVVKGVRLNQDSRTGGLANGTRSRETEGVIQNAGASGMYEVDEGTGNPE